MWAGRKWNGVFTIAIRAVSCRNTEEEKRARRPVRPFSVYFKGITGRPFSVYLDRNTGPTNLFTLKKYRTDLLLSTLKEYRTDFSVCLKGSTRICVCVCVCVSVCVCMCVLGGGGYQGNVPLTIRQLAGTTEGFPYSH